MQTGQANAAYSSHQAMFKDSPAFFIVAVLLIAAYGLGLVILGIWWITARTTRLEVANGRVTFERGLLSKDRVVIPLGSIRSVRVRQSLLQRLTGVGDVGIVSAGDAPEIRARGMPDVKRLREILQ